MVRSAAYALRPRAGMSSAAIRECGAGMIEAYGLYVASTVGAVALYLMMPRRGYNPRKFGALLGAAAVGGLWLWLGEPLFSQTDSGPSRAGMAYYYIFSGLAIVAATRVITHTKPVYSALWFVMVVLASAGLFIVLDAEFIAFGMVIIYGGAILVTYVFVIMLAAQSEEASDEAGEEIADAATPEYDRVAREPAAAVIVGFLLLALLLDVAFRPMRPNADAAGPTAKQLVEGDGDTPAVLADRAEQRVLSAADEDERAALEATGVGSQSVTNVERIGVDLFQGHPLGLELAGVILLVALVGAVVIARQRGWIEDAMKDQTQQR